MTKDNTEKKKSIPENPTPPTPLRVKVDDGLKIVKDAAEKRAKKASKARKEAVTERLLDELEHADLSKAARMIKVQAEALKLPPEMKDTAEIVHDPATDEYYLETDVPPYIAYDDATGRLQCEDAAVARFVQLATNGDPHKIKALCRSGGKVRLKVLQDASGWIRFNLLARFQNHAMTGELKDPAKSADMVMKILKEELEVKPNAAKRLQKLTDAAGSRPEIAELEGELEGLATPSHPVPEKGRGGE